MRKNPKFGVGDKVRVKLSAGGTEKLSEEVFEVTKVSVHDLLGTKVVSYSLKSRTGRLYDGVAESRLVAEATKPKPKALKAGVTTDSDLLLDTYNDYMALFEMFGDAEYKDKAEAARHEWHKRHGKLKRTEEKEEA